MSELLAPAGNLEKLKWACAYGADAVYFGIKEGSLRSYAGNFTIEEAAEGISHLHSLGKRGYATLNIYPFTDEYSLLIKRARELEECGADAFIVADLGILFEIKKAGLKTPVHISTQANTLSAQTVLAYAELGAKRVNLARELSFEQIVEIQKAVKEKDVETEVFIHGAVCFSYSGRCAISDYLTGRRANRGECTHSCRWKYYLHEEKRPGEFLPVAEDERGLYLFNSRELALFPYMSDLKTAGVESFKIEGRMKSIHYIASVVSFYRQVLDGKQFTEQEGLELLSRIPNRGYSHGFMKGHIEPDDYQYKKGESVSSAKMLGEITGKKDGKTLCRARNKITAGDTVETLSPDGTISSLVLPSPLITEDGEEIEAVSNPARILINQKLEPYTILRKLHNTEELERNNQYEE